MWVRLDGAARGREGERAVDEDRGYWGNGTLSWGRGSAARSFASTRGVWKMYAGGLGRSGAKVWVSRG